MIPKRTYAVPVFALAAIIAAYAIVKNNDSKPGFVANAEKSTNNFLQYTYGAGKCAAQASESQSWDMVCSYQHDTQVVTYVVQPLADAFPEESNKFHLIATNELAKRSATTGLTKYLDIDVEKM